VREPGPTVRSIGRCELITRPGSRDLVKERRLESPAVASYPLRVSAAAVENRRSLLA